MPMQLREVIKEIRHRKNWTQAQLAAHLQTNQQNVQGMENAGANLEKAFALFLKLLPICQDIGIDPARHLKIAEAEREVIRYAVQEIDREASRSDAHRTKRRKKKGSSVFSTRGTEGD